MTSQPLRFDQLLEGAVSGRLSRRDIVKTGTALGLGLPFVAALARAQGVGAQGGEVTLEFDAGATQGGGGKATADLLSYCWVVNGGSQFEFFRMVDARLVALSADLQEIVPDLAESWTLEGTTATFKLNPKAKWHDGTPVTSKDIAFTINVVCDPATVSRFGAAFTSVVGYAEMQGGAAAATPVATPADGKPALSGLSTPDDQTLVIELTQPDSGMIPGLLSLNIMPEHLLGGVDRATIIEDPFWTQTHIGAGPYKLGQLVEGERIELVANPDYHFGAPAISKITLLFFQSPETSLAALQQGSNLIAPMTVNDLELVESIEGVEVATSSAGVGSIQINVKQPEFADKRVRQAIAYAIDKNTIAESVYQGYGPATATEIPYIAWAQPEEFNPYDYDPEKAKSLLAEAGWDSSKSFKFWYYYPDQVTATAVEAMQQFLAEVGITIELQFDDGSGVRAQEIKDGTWYIGYGAFGAQIGPSNLGLIWGKGGAATWGYENPAFDEQLEGALRTYDQAEQAVFYKEAVRILNEDVPWVPLFNRQNLIAVNTAKLTTGQETSFGPGHIMYLNHANEWTVAP